MSTTERFAKYDVPAPRYTSYPTVPYWTDAPTTDQWTAELNKAFARDPQAGWSLYIHIPFCESLCTFCGSYLITGRKVRKRSIDNVIEEIKVLKSKYGVRSLDIVDENFVFYRDYVMEFCNRLIEEDIKIGWNCPYGVRLDRLDAELVATMQKAGCYALSVGIESATNRILKEIKKGLTVEQTIEKINMVRDAAPKIMLQGFFMIGFPDETEEEIEDTIELARSLPLDIAVFSPLRPTPGTQIYQDLVNSGVIYANLDYDPEGMGHNYFVRSYSPVSDDRMKYLYLRAYKRFFLRPFGDG